LVEIATVWRSGIQFLKVKKVSCELLIQRCPVLFRRESYVLLKEPAEMLGIFEPKLVGYFIDRFACS